MVNGNIKTRESVMDTEYFSEGWFSFEDMLPPVGSRVFRDMAKAEDGKPFIGPYNWALGVRTGEKPYDIAVDEEGMVAPIEAGRARGMSVTPDTPLNMHKLHKPEALGGDGVYPLWVLDLAKIGPQVRYRVTSNTHGVLEPVQRMSLEQYEEALVETKDHWTLVLE